MTDFNDRSQTYDHHQAQARRALAAVDALSTKIGSEAIAGIEQRILDQHIGIHLKLAEIHASLALAAATGRTTSSDITFVR